MFVLNCHVIKDEILKYVPKPSKRSRKRRRGAGGTTTNEQQPEAASEMDRYHPVRCRDCNTEVAVVDTDEVFHFFNVLPSASS